MLLGFYRCAEHPACQIISANTKMMATKSVPKNGSGYQADYPSSKKRLRSSIIVLSEKLSSCADRVET